MSKVGQRLSERLFRSWRLGAVPDDPAEIQMTPGPAERGSEAGGRAPASPWVIFSVMSVALLMSSVDSTIVATALPTLHESLRASLNWVGWTITAYQLGLTVAMPVAGRISDLLGRKRVFVLCVCFFTLMSLLCGLATSVYMLVPLRFLQALGGGAFMPSATGIISDHFGSGRDRAIGLFSSIFPLGMLIGPIFGGVIITYWSWRGIFFVNVPIGIVLTILATRLLPVSTKVERKAPDVVGVAQLGALLLASMYAITNLGNGHTELWSWSVLVPAAVAIMIAVSFARRSRRVLTPLIPLRLLGGKGFLVMNAINFLYGVSALGVGALIPLYAEDRYHLHPLEAGTLLTARGVGMIVLAAAAASALRWTGYRLPMVLGFVVAAGGLFLLSSSAAGVSPYAWLALTAGVTGVGIGICSPAANNATLALAPDDVAAVSGLRGMFRQAGAIFGISTVTAVVARSRNPGLELGRSFAVIAVLFLCTVVLVVFVPNRRASW